MSEVLVEKCQFLISHLDYKILTIYVSLLLFPDSSPNSVCWTGPCAQSQARINSVTKLEKHRHNC